MNICTFSCSEVNREEYKVIFSFRGVIFWETLLSIKAFYNVLIKGNNSSIYFCLALWQTSCVVQCRGNYKNRSIKWRSRSYNKKQKPILAIILWFLHILHVQIIYYISSVDLLVDLPDEFFEINENDIKRMMVDLQKKV